MKRIIFFWAVIAGSLLSHQLCNAQFGYMPYSKHEQLNGVKTLVVLTGNEAIDMALKQTVKANWTATPVTFIPKSQLARAMQTRNSFVLSHNIDAGSGRKALSFFKTGQELSEVSLSNLFAQSNAHLLDNPKSTIELQVQDIVHILDKFKDHKIGTSAKIGLVEEQKAIICANANQLKTKTLLLNKSDLDPQTDIKTLTQLYPYKLIIQSSEEMNDYIGDTKESVYFIQPSKEVRMMVYDTRTAEAIFASKKEGGDNQKITLEDIQELLSAIK